MIVQFNVMCAGMEDRVGSQVSGAEVITIEEDREVKVHTQFIKEWAKPSCFSTSMREGVIFQFCTRVWYCRLFIGNEVGGKSNDVASGWSTRIRTPSSIRIGVGGETSYDRLWSEGEAEFNSAIDVMKYPLQPQGALMNWERVLTANDTSGWVRVRYCKLPTCSQYLVGLEMRQRGEPWQPRG